MKTPLLEKIKEQEIERKSFIDWILDNHVNANTFSELPKIEETRLLKDIVKNVNS
jgi:hypothetical protein